MAANTPEDLLKDNLLFIGGVIVALFILWLAAGGPQRPSAREPFRVINPPTVGTGITASSSILFTTTTITPPNPFSLYTALFRTAAKNEKEQTKQQGDAPQLIFPLGAAGATLADPDLEYIAFSLPPDASGPVSLDGWYLSSRVSGATLAIPDAVTLLTPQDNRSEKPVVLQPGQVVFMTTGVSPLGVSFRANLCTGYFEHWYDFSPPLWRLCPNPALSDPQMRESLSQACINFAARLAPCEVPAIPPGADRQCERFLATTYSYAGCYRRTHSRPTFLLPEWRLFGNIAHELWRNDHDIIDLYDREGRVRATLRY